MKNSSTIKCYKNEKRLKAFGLSELMISVALIAIVIVGIIAVIVQSFISTITLNQRTKANELIQEQSGALNEYKKNNWTGIRNSTATNGSVQKYLSYLPTTTLVENTNVSNSKIIDSNVSGLLTDLRVGDSIALSSNPNTYSHVIAIVSDTRIIVDKPMGDGTQQFITRFEGYRINNGQTQTIVSGTTYTINFTLDRGLRNNTNSCSNYGKLDNSNNASCSYVEDNHYVWATFTVSWKDLTNNILNSINQNYINDWDNSDKVISSYNDMASGAILNNTVITNVSGIGNLRLSKIGGNYVSSGSYTSQIFDTENPYVNYFSIDFVGDLPVLSSGTLMMRASTSPQNLANATWVDFTPYCILIPNTNAPNMRAQCNLFDMSNNPLTQQEFIQFKINLTTSDASYTPLATSIEIFYQ